MTIRFWTHQRETIEFAKTHDRWYNASDPGTGKTLALLGHIAETGARTLILAPKTLLEPAWLADWKKLLPEDDVVVAWASNRKKAFERGTPCVITNIEAVNWLARKENRHHLKRFDLVICDEATAFRTPDSQRSKNARVVFQEIPQAVCMSGTPAPKSVQNLWHQYFLLDGGLRLSPSFSRFRFHFCKPVRPPGAPAGAIKWVDKPGALTEAAERVADITIRYRLQDCQDIPPNHTVWLGYAPNRTGKKAYEEMIRDAVCQLKNGELLVAANAAVARNKALQILSGASYTDTGYEVLDRTRVGLVADLIEARPASVVFYLWKHQRALLEAELAQRKIPVAFIDGSVPQTRRARIVEEFQSGRYAAVLLHPETGAHGLTLTRATSVIFTTPPGDRPDWLIQGVARVVRAGQTRKTETIFVYAEDSFERSIYQAIVDQKDAGEVFLDYLRRYTNDVERAA